MNAVLEANVCFGASAVIRNLTTSMAAFGGKADIKKELGGHKKARHKTGLSVFGSGGVICAVPTIATRVCLK